jgi:hypothetical protein
MADEVLISLYESSSGNYAVQAERYLSGKELSSDREIIDEDKYNFYLERLSPCGISS